MVIWQLLASFLGIIILLIENLLDRKVLPTFYKYNDYNIKGIQDKMKELQYAKLFDQYYCNTEVYVIITIFDLRP